jgi:GrpB-like predicted nucleotidyltransferase (UPF0157 family)
MNDQPSEPLGLEGGKVRLRDSDQRWPELFRAERERLMAAIGPLVTGIEHFGSTSIPGIKAKPILDILVGLKRFEDGTKLIEPLAGLGYDYVGTEMVPNDHLFGRGVVRTVLLHAVEDGGYHWRRNLRFRDRLRAEPGLAADYEALKVELAERFADKRAEYTAAKKAFIDSIADV